MGNDGPWEGRCAIRLRGPKPVGSFPDGRSLWCGAQDMVGSVWEYVRDGFAMGASYDDRGPVSGDGLVNRLKDPKPSAELWDRGTDEFKKRYSGK